MPQTYAIVGAGPSGLAIARALSKPGIRYVGFESAADVCGLWNLDRPWAAAYFRERAERPLPDLIGGYKRLALGLMTYRLDEDACRRTIRRLRETLIRKPSL